MFLQNCDDVIGMTTRSRTANNLFFFQFPVEKVTVIARLVDPSAVENNQVILTTLAHIFCHLIGGLNDVHSAVVQRTSIYLDTIKDSGIRVCTLKFVCRYRRTK